MLFAESNNNNIRISHLQPTTSEMIKQINYIKMLGYNKIYYTCNIEKNKIIQRVEKDLNVKIYDKKDAIIECLKKRKYNLLKIVEQGIF